ncbi:Hypothetical protein RAK1035_3123 [Roseovarius sp. AK1035]|nr:Hypothetical protein RAK1035_3123 [Roseovarius sp. AK1035]
MLATLFKTPASIPIQRNKSDRHRTKGKECPTALHNGTKQPKTSNNCDH